MCLLPPSVMFLCSCSVMDAKGAKALLMIPHNNER